MGDAKALGAPLFERQAVYWSTGAMAGLGALLASRAATNFAPAVFPAAVVNSGSIRHAMACAGMRFLVFDLCRDATQETISSPALRGGLAGAAGGLAETLQAALAQAVTRRSIQPLHPQILGPQLLSHSGTLFLCFGGYTLLSTTYTKTQPPSPPMTFFLGALAGAFGVPAANIIKMRTVAGLASLSAVGFVRVGLSLACKSRQQHEYSNISKINVDGDEELPVECSINNFNVLAYCQPFR